jgi:hypothetical protein
MSKKKFAKTIHSDFSRHSLHVSEIAASDFPDFENKDGYTKFYAVRNWDAEGVTLMYLGSGLQSAPKEIVVWYKKGGFWHSYGKTLKEAIEGAQRDGWLYA